MLKIDNITVQYGNNKPTIEDFNLEISSGEIVAIVGESGSGKTTSLSWKKYSRNAGKKRIPGNDPLGNLTVDKSPL